MSFQNKVFSPEYLQNYFDKAQSFYDEIDLEEFKFDQERNLFFYPCPCGDNFIITVEHLLIGENKATCPSCSLILKVSYDMDDIEKFLENL